MRILLSVIVGAVEFFWIPTFVTSWVYTGTGDIPHKIGVLFSFAWMNIVIGVKVARYHESTENKGADSNGLE